MNEKLKNKAGIRELMNFWGNDRTGKVPAGMKVSFKDIETAIKEFVMEHGKLDKKKHMTFRCQGWSDTWRRRGIGFATAYPYLTLKRLEKRKWEKKYKYYNYDFSVRRISVVNDKIIIKTFVKHSELGNEFEFNKELFNKFGHKEYWGSIYYWLLEFINDLYRDAENDGCFMWYCTGLNGTPDSIVCAGQKD